MLSLGHWCGISGDFLLTSASKHAHCIEVAAKRKIKGKRKIAQNLTTCYLVNILEVIFNFMYVCK